MRWTFFSKKLSRTVKIPNGFTLSDNDILSNPFEDSDDPIPIDPFNKTMCEIRENLETGVCVDVKGSNN